MFICLYVSISPYLHISISPCPRVSICPCIHLPKYNPSQYTLI
jgi:hypothetical protein